MEYDMFRQRDGNLQIKPRGESVWYGEEDFQKLAGLDYPVRRMIAPDAYALFRQAGAGLAHQDMKIPLEDESLMQAVRRFEKMANDEKAPVDIFAFDEWRTKTLYAMNPHVRRYGARWRFYTTGTYIPEGKILPLGDNRDNSRDGRYFGSVRINKILGKAMFCYWPLFRIGNIH
jgi:signal peptidase I